MKSEYIKIRGARQHNLKNINADIPKNKLVVFTGVSGSGKSSLAFDTIYAEGQRRYVESLSTYARQFLGIMEKPDIDYIEGLSPAISIDQKTTSKNPRSTVGTVTEIYDYLRLLFARVGHPHCPICGREIQRQTTQQIVDGLIKIIVDNSKDNKQGRYLILSPVVIDKKGEFTSLFDNLKSKGFRQVRVDKYIKDLNDDFLLIKTNKHTIEALVDRLVVNSKNLKDNIYRNNLKSRLNDSVEQTLKLSDGLLVLTKIEDKGYGMPDYPKEFKDFLFSEKFSCPLDNIQLSEIEPRTFSFNSPHGACSPCGGIGKILKVDPNLIFSEEISIMEGGILPFSNMFQNDTWYSRLLSKVCQEEGINTKVPIKQLESRGKNIILRGTGNKSYRVEGTNRLGRLTSIYETFSGVIAELERRHAQSESDWVRLEIEKYMRERICDSCKGTRLKTEALSITIDNKSISDVSSYSIENIIDWVKVISNGHILNEKELNIAGLILKEIEARLGFLMSVGLEYLTLNRSSGTLSGGEAQRIRLASQIGSGLTGVLYVLDEPTIGLHMKDNQKLINTLKNLKNLGNSVIVVEHDSEMIKQSDYVLDFGPGAGKEGGELVYLGPSKEIIKSKRSLTGKYISGQKKVGYINVKRSFNSIKRQIKIEDDNSFMHYDSKYHRSLKKTNKKILNIYGCNQFNLKNIDVSFPLSKFVVITGVSGSGKSTLLVETLYPALKNYLFPYFKGEAGSYRKLSGTEYIDKVVLIDQSPIGRTPRSNPATYTKLFDPIREVFSKTKDARSQGYKKGRFSFNVKGGRCEACQGQGQIKIEMQFMSDIWIKCDVCAGTRYNSQTLEVEYNGKNISEVLDMTVAEAIDFFHVYKTIVDKLNTLISVGLGYIDLGQPATTLSGGEAQRVKLATELSKRSTGKTVYILDEPTTGLHFADVEKLLTVLKTLTARGNSVFIIEHHPDIIRNADWIIDLGPEGGERGGQIVVEGKLKEIMNSRESYTGEYLRDIK